jgi:RHS repeat-associated protein
LHRKGIDEPSEWGHREMDGQAREGNGRDERERTSQILMRADPSVNGGLFFFYHQDHEGSVTHLTDANGTIIEKYRYDVFGTPSFYNGGDVQISTSAYNNRFLFTGREYLGAWIYDYRARLYHGYLGRFMSEDPKGFDAGDYNLFRYCHNDPIDNVDPMGLEITLQPGPNHASPLMEESARQMLFSSSYGAIAYGMAAYAYGQLQQAMGSTGKEQPTSAAPPGTVHRAAPQITEREVDVVTDRRGENRGQASILTGLRAKNLPECFRESRLQRSRRLRNRQGLTIRDLSTSLEMTFEVETCQSSLSAGLRMNLLTTSSQSGAVRTTR